MKLSLEKLSDKSETCVCSGLNIHVQTFIRIMKRLSKKLFSHFIVQEIRSNQEEIEEKIQALDCFSRKAGICKSKKKYGEVWNTCKYAWNMQNAYDLRSAY